MMRLKWLLLFGLLAVIIGSEGRITIAQAPPANPPVLFFSDLTFGPNTGWNGSTTQGAAVTVWGKNFGAARNSSYITVNGARLTTDANYAEWDAIGPARGLERITFWVPSAATTGAGTISVTVGGVTSNTLPFEVATATIFFIDVANGNNSNNGRSSTNQGGGNGPWRDLYMFNPGLDGQSNGKNPLGDGQYITYVRAGTYTTQDVDSAFIALRGPYGGPTKRKALIGYPGETPTINALTASRGVAWNATYAPYGRNSYFTWAKLKVSQGFEAFEAWGDNNRVVGNQMVDMRETVWSGVVMVDNSQYTSVFGNLFKNDGFDSYKHNVYIKTHQDHITGDLSVNFAYVGWNEFDSAFASDTHGGVIFVSRESSTPGKSTDNVFIHDNYFHDGNMDYVYIGDGTPIANVYLYKNIFAGGTSSNGAITMQTGSTNCFFYSNVFYQTGPANTAMIFGTGTARGVFKDNIWFSRSGQAFLNWENFQGATFSSDHDLFYNPGGATNPPSGGGVTVTGALTGDPRFVNPAGYDFHLQSGSPTRGVGVNLASTIGAFQWGGNDYDGKPYPASGPWDLGAILFAAGSGGGTPTPPAAPTNLRIVR